MTTTTIFSTSYFPPVFLFWAMNHHDEAKVEMNENYQKKSYRNRARILSVNGIQTLSIPLKKGKNSKTPISEVFINYDENWIGSHLHSIRSAYGNSPYFDFYYESIVEILEHKHKLLVELNGTLLDFFLEQVPIEISIGESEEYIKDYPPNVLDLRNIKYPSPDLQFYTPKKYSQVFEDRHDFAPNLSMLDLLMCKGPESILYI